jgi:integrase
VKGRRTGGLLINVRVHPDLVDALSAMKVVGSATYLVTPRGGAFTADYLSERMRTWCAAAGLPDETASHGLRKLCLMRLAEAGCTAFEIMSISGHKNLKEVQRYVEAASRKKMGEAAHAKLLAVQNTNKSVPTPAPRVGHSPK